MSLHVVHICGVCSLSVFQLENTEKKRNKNLVRDHQTRNKKKQTAKQTTKNPFLYPIAIARHISLLHLVQLNDLQFPNLVE